MLISCQKRQEKKEDSIFAPSVHKRERSQFFFGQIGGRGEGGCADSAEKKKLMFRCKAKGRMIASYIAEKEGRRGRGFSARIQSEDRWKEKDDEDCFESL